MRKNRINEEQNQQCDEEKRPAKVYKETKGSKRMKKKAEIRKAISDFEDDYEFFNS